MVRLKVETGTAYQYAAASFQFQYGAIKRPGKKSNPKLLDRFNSNMVRLKVM